MINVPFASPGDFVKTLHPRDEKEVLWFIFSGNKLLVEQDKKSLPRQHHLALQRHLYMGSLKNKHLYIAEIEIAEQIPEGWSWIDLRMLYGVMSEDIYALAGQALQLIEWDRTNKYCGRCGAITFSREKERCRECTACGHLAYVKLAPAIMALVKKGEQILLARSSHFPDKFYSVLAGFLDPGETLEQGVAREVLEEVGLKIKNIQYFGSQPWPFSQSLMMAFTCEWEKGKICIDPLEIEEAAWFHISSLPMLPPPLSIARMLIDAHVIQNKGHN